MTASSYILRLRDRIGDDLLLLPSVAALIHDEWGRLLLLRKEDPDSWSLPAGGIEPGETPEEALHREVLEETGASLVTADLVAVLGGKAFRFRYPNGHLVEYTVILFRCTLADPASALTPLDAETHELRYFAETEIPALALPYPLTLLFPNP